MDGETKLALAGIIMWLSFVVASVSGYITHISWFIKHPDQVVIGIVGLIPFVGVVHGWGLWFGWWH